MKRIEFDQMMERLERLFHDRGPELTRACVLWAAMGYAVLLLGLLLSLGLVYVCGMGIYLAPGGLTVQLGIIFGGSGGVIAWSILRGAWIRLPLPEGEELTRDLDPRLFEMIEATSALAGGVRIHRVLLVDDLNACVIQSPRLGIFGWYRNFLCLGIQLLDALPPEEFQVVLAHEFAHLSRAHGRAGNWLYRTRRSWENVACALSAQGGLLVRPLGWFFEWFWPRFNARAFVLSRNNEYEADAFSAAVASPATAANALVRIAVEGMRVDRDFWGRLDERSAREPEPPAAIFDEVAAFFKTHADAGDTARRLEQALARCTDTSDTHPALKDRIASLAPGASPALARPVRESAADSLLGPERAVGLRAVFSRMWLAAHGGQWSGNHARHIELRGKLDALDAVDDTPKGRWKRLSLEIDLQGVPAMAAGLKSFLEEHPDHHVARFVLGSHLLSIDDAAGIPMLESVAGALPHVSLECFNQLAGYHDRRGDAAAIRELKRRADETESLMLEALAERSSAGAGDDFGQHDLADDELAGMRWALAGVSQLQEAWLSCRHARRMPEWKSYVMIVKLRFPFLRLVTERARMEVLQRIADLVEVDGHLLVLAEGSQRAVSKEIKELPAARVFSRKEWNPG